MIFLTIHLLFGLRVLAIEFLPWRGQRLRLVHAGLGVALVAGALFVLSAW